MTDRPAARHMIPIAVVGVLLMAAFSTGVVVMATRGRSGRLTSNCAVPALRGRVVDVALDDRGASMMGGATPMMVSLTATPDQVRGPTVSLLVANYGHLVHEVVMLPLPSDGAGTRPVGSNNKADETGSLGEASKSCGLGIGDGIAPGSPGWVTLNLKPGRYELICNEPGHYQAGMFDILTVT